MAFTKHYRREGGQEIDVSVLASVVGWASVAGVIHSQNGGTPSEVVHTMAAGDEKKKRKNLITVT